MYEKERNLAVYGYIIYAFGKMAEENSTIREKLKELKDNTEKQLNVDMTHVRYDGV